MSQLKQLISQFVMKPKLPVVDLFYSFFFSSFKTWCLTIRIIKMTNTSILNENDNTVIINEYQSIMSSYLFHCIHKINIVKPINKLYGIPLSESDPSVVSASLNDQKGGGYLEKQSQF